jgi:molybdenum cofactor synthesis domain-containing protein
LSRPRAVVVVTGSELVRGERTDLNGPFLAREALRLGFEPARIAIVGDAPEELEATLREALASADAVLVSGGLGPTHDDRTVEVAARALGVGLHVDAGLEAQIEAVSRAAAARLQRDYADFAPGVTKQATVPDGAISLGLAGTAPGLLVPRDGGRVVVILPGPPAELKRLWPNALETEAFEALLARAAEKGGGVICISGAARSPPLRGERVGRRARTRRGRGGRRRRRGDDLRARLRDPRRLRRRAGSRDARRRARGHLPAAAGAMAVRP